MSRNLDELILQLLPVIKEKLAIIDDNQSVSYLELYQMIMDKSKQFSNLGQLQGRMVICIFNENIEGIVSHLALMLSGAIPVIVNPEATKNDFIHYIATVKARIGLCASDVNFELPEEIADEFKLHKQTATKNSSIDSHDEFVVSDNPRFCLFTSGTTGKPNAVIHDLDQVLFMNEHYGHSILNIKSEDVLYSLSKSYFAYGINAILFAILNGATICVSARKFNADEILKRIINNKVTLLFAVPTLYSRILSEAKAFPKINTVRACISAGENMPMGIQNDWHAKFKTTIVDGIGTTETLSTFISNNIDDVKPGCTGKLVAGFEVEIRNPITNELVNTGETGVLWVKGDSLADYYINNLSDTNSRFSDGWFKTNDLFSADKDAYYYYHGRVNDVVKMGGVWIYLRRIELCLYEHPKVKEAAVIGMKQANELMRPVVFITLNNSGDENDATKLARELKEFCKRRCSRYEYPHFVYVVESLPRTASGKVKKYLLLEMIEGVNSEKQAIQL